MLDCKLVCEVGMDAHADQSTVNIQQLLRH